MKEIVVTVKYGLAVPDDFEMTDENLNIVRKAIAHEQDTPLHVELGTELSQEWEDRVWSQGWF